MPAQDPTSTLKRARAKANQQPQRAPWGSMSRTQVVNAAIDVVSAGGYEQMTIRSLAARLGVAPMSLYRHVRDKDDLLDEVVDRLLSHAWRPRASRNNWRAWVGEACEKLRAFLVAQPAAMHVFLTHPVVSPAAVERMEAVMSVLRSAGFDEPSAKRAYAAIHTYTLGFSALEAGRVGWAPADGRVSALAKQLAAYTTPRQFGEGLNYLLDGIARSAGVAEATGKPPRRKGS